MKYIAYVLAALLGGFGVLVLIAAGQGNAVVRIVVGVLCIAGAATLVALLQLKPIQITHRQQIDMSGDVSVQNMTCRQCGATLSSKSVQVAAGAVFVHCEFCGAQYQLEEAPKW